MSAKLLKRALAVWLLIIIAESIHGTLRTLYLEPIMGNFRARQLSAFTATIIIFTITWFTMRWMRAATLIPTPQSGGGGGAAMSRKSGNPANLPNATCLTIGAMWVALTLIFEFSLGLSLGMSWSRMLEDYNLARGGLMLLGLAAMFATPWVANRYRKDKV